MTPDEVRALFEYDPETGVLRRDGRVTGTRNKSGYLVVRVRGTTYYAHRLAWLLTYGEWPSAIDHINMDKADNRLANLRLATKSENLANQRGRAKSGFKGVWRRQRGKPWAASIRKNRKTYHLGTYDTREQASEAYRAAAASMHGEFARG